MAAAAKTSDRPLCSGCEPANGLEALIGLIMYLRKNHLRYMRSPVGSDGSFLYDCSLLLLTVLRKILE